MIKLCIPKVQGRGAGLGNELIPWAKAFIASQELGLRLLHPAWGLNQRGYRDYFGTSRFDWFWQRALMAVSPVITFSEDDYRRYGHDDFGAAVRAFAKEKGLNEKPAFILEIEGMWGGYLSISDARDFVLTQLYHTRYTRENLYDINRLLPKDRLVVAVHIRRGDFLTPVPEISYKGCFNVSLPLDWYVNACRNLNNRFRNRVTFLLISDGSPDEFKVFTDEFSPVCTFHQHNTAISDLLALAKADLLVCSVSSYSMWAAFLSGRPYLWYSPQLQQEDGRCSLWGHETTQRSPDGRTSKNIQSRANAGGGMLTRGIPVNQNGDLSEEVMAQMESIWQMKQRNSDLIYYGAV